MNQMGNYQALPIDDPNTDKMKNIQLANQTKPKLKLADRLKQNAEVFREKQKAHVESMIKEFSLAGPDPTELEADIKLMVELMEEKSQNGIRAMRFKINKLYRDLYIKRFIYTIYQKYQDDKLLVNTKFESEFNTWTVKIIKEFTNMFSQITEIPIRAEYHHTDNNTPGIKFYYNLDCFDTDDRFYIQVWW
jgi:hypothetical protein